MARAKDDDPPYVYEQSTWARVLMPGTIVKGADGQPWKVEAVEDFGVEQAGRGRLYNVTVWRRFNGQKTMRTKGVVLTDPVEIEVRWLDTPEEVAHRQFVSEVQGKVDAALAAEEPAPVMIIDLELPEPEPTLTLAEMKEMAAAQPPVDFNWKFPAMTDPEHLRSHLFIVHNHFGAADEDPAERHANLHAAATPDAGFPHVHTSPQKGS